MRGIAIRKRTFFILTVGALALAVIAYLALYFSLTGETIAREVSRIAEREGYHVKIGEISKRFPFHLVGENITFYRKNYNDGFSLSSVSLEVLIFKLLGKEAVRLTFHDPEGSVLSVTAPLRFRSAKIISHGFSFKPGQQSDLPSFQIRELQFLLDRIISDKRGEISLHGKGIFHVEKIVIPKGPGYPVMVDSLEGKAFVKNDSLYFKESKATLFSSLFHFEGTVSGIKNLAMATVDIDAKSENPSPFIANLLNYKSNSGNNLKIRIRGRLSSPKVRTVKR